MKLDNDGRPVGDADLAATADRLAVQVEQLKVEVRELNDRQDETDRRQDRSDRMSMRTALVLGLVVLLAAVVGLIVYQQIVTRSEVSSVVDRETTTRVKVLCPVFALVLGGYDPSTRPDGPARQQYEDNFRVMGRSYDLLACQDPLVPRRTG